MQGSSIYNDDCGRTRNRFTAWREKKLLLKHSGNNSKFQMSDMVHIVKKNHKLIDDLKAYSAGLPKWYSTFNMKKVIGLKGIKKILLESDCRPQVCFSSASLSYLLPFILIYP